MNAKLNALLRPTPSDLWKLPSNPTISMAAFESAVDKSDSIVISPQSGVVWKIEKADAKRWARSSINLSKDSRWARAYVQIPDELLMIVGCDGNEPGAMEVVP